MSRESFEDDGRTIVDMSGVDRRTPLGYIPAEGRKKREAPAPGAGPDRPWEDVSLSRAERWAVIRGALGAALGITGIFGAAAAVVIWLILRVGGM